MKIPEPQNSPDGLRYEGRLLDRADEEVVDHGISFDIGTLVSRRSMMGLLGTGVGAFALAACSTGTSQTTPTQSANAAAIATPSASAAATVGAVEEIPE
ncbi:hypothetical protein [Arthrobacter psychrolactophilus]|uniref:hypothetical protein n=1 Tax=Arthrobacter psychrolactophilus TaxID=92442 RepID=UPI0026AD66AC|nr:hypothetical protein [Arthrobacter psychrolactophilus]